MLDSDLFSNHHRHGRADHRGVGLITRSAAAIILLDLWLVCIRTRALRRSLLDIPSPTRLTLRSIRFATVAMTLLAIIGAWLTMSINRFPKDWLTAPNIAVVVFVLGPYIRGAVDGLDGDLQLGGQHQAVRPQSAVSGATVFAR